MAAMWVPSKVLLSAKSGQPQIIVNLQTMKSRIE
jgi:hypothetical protein